MRFSPDWLTTQYRYREKAGSSSRYASQTPSLIFSMGFTESSQLLNSPTTETLCALGAPDTAYHAGFARPFLFCAFPCTHRPDNWCPDGTGTGANCCFHSFVEIAWLSSSSHFNFRYYYHIIKLENSKGFSSFFCNLPIQKNSYLLEVHNKFLQCLCKHGIDKRQGGCFAIKRQKIFVKSHSTA